MRVNLDLGKCMGYGNCVDAAPEVFDLNEDTEQAIILIAEPGSELEEAAQRAMRACPAKAITLS
ncbi:ferredoxin [Microbacterium gorillae]|uniref:ferredoxin n=1 Tax=Microbacterium gorillae TaxID=1231063 RepID=UPI00058C7594|nr:ferredoxin [Microbacterium gorillae]